MTRAACTVSDINYIYKVLLDNQATLHVLEMRLKEQISGCLTGDLVLEASMAHGLAYPTVRCAVQSWCRCGYLNKYAVVNVTSWLKSIRAGAHPDYFEEYDTFVLYSTKTTG